MKYQVGLQDRAESDSNRIYLWLRSRSETGAGSWFAALLRRLKKLESDAPNCPRAKEADRFADDLRETGSPPFLLKMVFCERHGASSRSLSPTPAASAVPLSQTSNTNGGEPQTENPAESSGAKWRTRL